MFKCLFIAGLALTAACAADVTEPADAELARGGRPGAAADGIAPVALLNHRKLGCSTSAAVAVNSGTPTTITGSCDRNAGAVPFVWTAATGAVTLDAAPGGMGGSAVSFDGTTFGSAGWRPYYRRPGGTPIDLPLPAGRTLGEVSDASASGDLVIGYAFPEGGTIATAVSWRWSGTGWEIGTVPPAATLDGDGDVLAGIEGGHAAVWVYASGGWAYQALDDGDAIESRASGVNDDGDVIVGIRVSEATVTPAPSGEPVAWVSDGAGGWTRQNLAGLSGFSEGEALAVQRLVDGRVAVVGWLWEDLAGAGEQLWAVAWIRAAGSTQFGPPLKLSPLARGASAWARDINVRGEVAGISDGKGLSRSAVKWQLP